MSDIVERLNDIWRDDGVELTEARGAAATATFKRGDYVRKCAGAFWEGTVVGDYSTLQTGDGVSVQLFGWDNGPVQIYPAAALEIVDPANGALASTRDAALEEAAVVTDKYRAVLETPIAAAACRMAGEVIRAMKGKQP